jgi:hypothetical protein
MNKVVARFMDGRVVKGVATDFVPMKESFHLAVEAAAPGSRPEVIQTKDLKALFFVKDFAGDPTHVERKEFDQSQPPIGRKIRVAFRDGEVLVGTTTGYQPGRAGFFLVPADPKSNMERCYVVAAAAREIGFI